MFLKLSLSLLNLVAFAEYSASAEYLAEFLGETPPSLGCYFEFVSVQNRDNWSAQCRVGWECCDPHTTY
jgi:hypothetical protein